MKKLSADVCAVTHAGRVRRENEDNYSLNGKLTSTGELKKGSAYVQHMKEPFHISVCDGMGGESYGDVASSIAVEEIAKTAGNVFDSGDDFSFVISNALGDANDKICSEIMARGSRMGTTLAAVYVVKGKAICVGMGDTRIYHFSNGMLEQMSFDHTHAQGFVDAMAVSQDDAGMIPDAKRLTKHLGVFPEEATLSPNISVIDDVDNGDIILLCSDGLTDMVSDSEIQEILASGDNARDVTGRLIKKALEKGGKDNVTVVTAFMEAEETAVFMPIAEAMVGDSDPDYSEEYQSSYGDETTADGENAPSPYANVDSSIAKQPMDKLKIMKIAIIAIVALAVLTIAALVIKGVVSGKEEETTTTESTTEYVITTTEPVISEWDIEEETSEETTTEESTTEETTTTTTTTRRYSSTTRRYSTTRSSSTSRRASSSSSTSKPAESSSKTDTSSSSSESSGTVEDNSNSSVPSSESSSSSSESSSSSSESSSSSQPASSSESSSGSASSESGSSSNESATDNIV